jgi:redox-sensing transcriptional repressor
MPDTNRVPIPTLLRLACYYRVLVEQEERGAKRLNSAEIAHLCGISATQVRKDLSFFGLAGKPGVGYDPTQLRERVARVLKLDRKHQIVIVGAGRLGQALAAYTGFHAYNFDVRAVFDIDPAKIGKRIGRNLVVQDIRDLREHICHGCRCMGALTVPADQAQRAADALFSVGIYRILNFTPAPIDAPNGAIVRTAAFTPEFAVLAFFDKEEQPEDR